MDKAALLAAYDEELRRRAPYFDPEVRLERDRSVVRLLGATADAGNNCVLYSALEDDAAGEIDRQVAYFRGLGRGFEWKLHAHDRPSSLASLLRERGFEPEAPEAVMAFALTGTLGFPAPAGYSVRALRADEDLSAVFEVQAAVWTGEDLGWLNASLLRERAAAPDSIRFHAAWDSAGRPVCAGWTRVHGRFASLFGGSTRPEHRGRGLYRALLASRAVEARRLGASVALVDAGPMSRPILARLGFEELTGTTPYVKRFSTPQK